MCLYYKISLVFCCTLMAWYQVMYDDESSTTFVSKLSNFWSLWTSKVPFDTHESCFWALFYSSPSSNVAAWRIKPTGMKYSMERCHRPAAPSGLTNALMDGVRLVSFLLIYTAWSLTSFHPVVAIVSIKCIVLVEQNTLRLQLAVNQPSDRTKDHSKVPFELVFSK